MKHTSTPWEVVSLKRRELIAGVHDHVVIATVRRSPYAPEGLVDANNAFLVRAVNCHEQLLDGCRTMKSWIEKAPNISPEEMAEEMEWMKTFLTEAIAKAEGE